MSTPISACQVIKAAKGDEQVFQRLVEVMDYNMAHGAWSVFPCEHNPKCEKPTEEEMEKFNVRLMGAIDERRKAARAKARPIGGFDKFIFPVIKNMAAPLRAKDFHEAVKDDHAKKRAPKHN